MELEVVTTLALVAFLASCVALDLTIRRIPNVLTIGGLVVALALRAPLGVEVVGAGLLAAALGFAFALPWFLVGGLGGGDVKLMAGVAAFLGPGSLVTALVVMALTGVLMASVAVILKRQVGRTMGNLLMIVLTFGRRTFTGWKGSASEAPLTLHTPGVITVPYVVAIAAGGLAGWFL